MQISDAENNFPFETDLLSASRRRNTGEESQEDVLWNTVSSFWEIPDYAKLAPERLQRYKDYMTLFDVRQNLLHESYNLHGSMLLFTHSIYHFHAMTYHVLLVLTDRRLRVCTFDGLGSSGPC